MARKKRKGRPAVLSLGGKPSLKKRVATRSSRTKRGRTKTKSRVSRRSYS